MVGRQPRAADLDRPAMQPLGFLALALAAQRLGEIVQALCRRRMGRAERRVSDRERVGVVGQRLACAALGVQDEAEIVRGGGTARIALGQLLGQRQQNDMSQWLRRGLPYCSTILRCSTAGSRQAPVESWPTMLR